MSLGATEIVFSYPRRVACAVLPTTRVLRRSTAALVLVALVLGPTPAFPAPLDAAPTTRRPLQRSGVVGKFDPAMLPPGVNPDQVVQVIVELSDPPVAVSGGNAADLARKQDPLKSAIAGQGGIVTRQYQHALNGFAVRIAARNAANLARLPGVSAVKRSRTYRPDNAQSVPYIGAPAVWQGPDEVHGENVKIAVVDSGIDYTHANFGGPGTVAAYDAANATDTAPADPMLFGPNARTKVKGGTDLVGDGYDGAALLPNGQPDLEKRTPHPDPNPLDCSGHGSHVAGTAAGFGVTGSGATFHGPYDASTPAQSFRIGPGVAPLADLYAVRVFGCDGTASTDVIIDAIEWAVQNRMDVVNMSLGTPFGGGSNDNPEVAAVNNASRAGLLMVTSSGNGGTQPYMLEMPGSADRALSVAAVDSKQTFPGAIMGLSTGRTITAINANNANLPGGSLPIMVVRDPGGNVSLGCDDADYPASVAGKLVVTRRGVCDRVDRAVLAQQHGALAAAMINTDAGLPPFEGNIHGVTIPFLGVRGELDDPASDAQALLAADGGTTTLAGAQLTNPSVGALASFTAGGPRFDDSFLKPEVSAPGVAIVSTDSGTGNGSIGMSGTSMAAPHVAGLAALVQQSHEVWWSSEDLKQAIVNTADPTRVADYDTRLGGAGVVRAEAATRTVAVAFGRSDKSTLSYGFDWDVHDMRETALLLVRNHGPKPITFQLSQELPQGAPHSISFERTTLEVPAWGHASTNVTLNVPISSVGNADELRDVAGLVKLTPTGSGNGGIPLRVPYYLVARALSNIQAALQGQTGGPKPAAQVRLNNSGGAILGTADFYAWGQVDDKPLSLEGRPFELRSSGVQAFFGQQLNEQVVVFALNTRNRIANFAPFEFDILLQNELGDYYQVFSFDQGALTAGTFDGQAATFVAKLSPDFEVESLVGGFLSIAPHNGNTILMPVLASSIGLSEAAPRFHYAAFSFDAFTDAGDELPGEGTFNAFNSATETAQFVGLAPGQSTTVTAGLDPLEAGFTPAKGLMIVALDNNWEHGDQVELINLTVPAPAPAAAATARSAVKPIPSVANLAPSHLRMVRRAPELSTRR
jgi:subtilisin family serine protease